MDSAHSVTEGNLLKTILGANILVVDDMQLMRKMIGMCLERAGYSNISFAEDGDDALKMISEGMPDLVILDLNMPRMSGYEVCKALRANRETENLPILVQSASETPEERVEVFASGATDFVSKPINQPELLARVQMHLENRFMIQNLSDFHDHMQRELSLAKEMQHALLPQDSLIEEVEQKAGMVIEAEYQASFELGGDLWGLWPIDDTSFGMFVLDISGHGVGASLNTFRVQATMGRHKHLYHDPAAFLLNLNSDLVESFPLGQFGTMFYAVIDTESGAITYAGAGAPRPFIISDDNVRTLDSAGTPIGIIASATYENLTDQLNEGESLFCYSDVLIETPFSNGEMLGENGLRDLVSSKRSEGVGEKLVEKLLATFFEEIQTSLPDDLTAVAFHRTKKVAGS
ncbi:PP2C family protein-serine/threonine phosphatase [Kordiimonas sp. SCSIO 12610]|uniref:PP2C family protein-serine/threonine phosphatase n=1 Tax=Kordiimonas sp. SCSIO 12610 TaxID=2829597 RepID=UPI002108C44D|nr:fused response regulator/phosphatase [Kordiimonas sp. SCSIO 12610]UTW56728.1 fused response regulator/phosphatase [Kordiimonas sp. SCSIO 12610]